MSKQTMGKVISSLRKSKGMTQLELAERMNVTDKAVSKWERDLSCPDVNSIPKLAELFETSVDELLQVKEKSNGDSKADEIIGIILKAVPLAMGVAVTVTSILKQIDIYSSFTMVGIALFCVGLSSFKDRKD